ncbi:hypothetical protein [Actomonas aquatica]|uniref:Uncharacterized protein n=1 Tax=Actomonas aquatica TaxID=2866162 RepID=A0ABZ1C8A4_9BACT|nr:hypothetical protein [Opitutus sp. WL0086]WRQ87927.1 hypothetical protein K1X11_000805 [Opitutus sp. WL0086]
MKRQRSAKDFAAGALLLALIAGALVWWDHRIRSAISEIDVTSLAISEETELPSYETRILDLGYASIAVPSDFPRELSHAGDGPFVLSEPASGYRILFGAPQSTRAPQFVEMLAEISSITRPMTRF